MPHTTGTESLLLRSPKASEGEGGALGEAEALKRGNTVGVRDQVMDLVAGQGLQVSRQADNLLPTPRAQEPGSTSAGYGDGLNDVANRLVHGFAPKDLLPTPNTMEHREIKTPEQIAELKELSPGGYRNLREVVINELPDSSLFMTPSAVEGEGGSVGERKKLALGHYVMLRDQVKDLAEDNLLPTPVVRDYKDGQAPSMRDGKVSVDTVGRAIMNSGEVNLLPTLRASDGYERRNQKTMDKIAAEGGDMTMPTLARTFFNSGEIAESNENNLTDNNFDLLPTVTTNGNERKGPGYSSAGILQELEITNGILPKEYLDWSHAAQKTKKIPEQKSEKTSLDETITWGKFTAAIKRWEAVTRPVPAPTKPDGKNGNHRLSAEFTEWMMGLPAGWVTDPEMGLKRNDQLKACGNGVVPQQAELALRILLQDVTLEGITC